MSATAELLSAKPGFHPWIKGDRLTDSEALIIVGSYRCGTTSLFSYLADHPEINPSLIKEPGFFFSRRIMQKPSPYPAGHEDWAYLSMFKRKAPAHVLLEATANYLHDPGCAQRIERALPNSRIVIALRDPVARLVSWYKFILHRGWWDPELGFEEWIDRQLSDTRPVDERPYHLQAVDHGFYSSYIKEYLEVFGQERVHFVWFDDICNDAYQVMKELSQFAGISPDFYDSYDYPAQNEAMKITHPGALAVYRKLYKTLFMFFHGFPRLEHEMRIWLFGYIEPKLLRFLTGPADSISVSEITKKRLSELYRSDLALLKEATGGDNVPWE